MAAGIWVRLMHKNRIERDTTVECAHEEWIEALEKACHQLDVPRPMILPRHERDWEQFNQTRFLREHFVEDVPFDLMQHIVKRIITEVKGVNRVLYDFTPKPTGTIEWE